MVKPLGTFRLVSPRAERSDDATYSRAPQTPAREPAYGGAFVEAPEPGGVPVCAHAPSITRKESAAVKAAGRIGKPSFPKTRVRPARILCGRRVSRRRTLILRRALLALGRTLLALRRALILIRSRAALSGPPWYCCGPPWYCCAVARIAAAGCPGIAAASALGLVGAAALMPLRMALTHLLVILILLVAVQHAHDLLSKLAAGTRIARASFGMILRIAVDERLNALLLIAR